MRHRWLVAVLCLLAVSAAATAAAITSTRDETTAGRINTFPAPGTQTASPRTQISLRGAARDSLGEVTVVGSRSGMRKGELKPHSDGRGASFVPTQAFRAGERVRVSTDLNIDGAGDGDFGFTVARRPSAGGVNDGELALPTLPPAATHRFLSRPDLQAPMVRVTKRSQRTAPGYLFLAPFSPKGSPKPDGPMIVDDRGDLVWFRALKRGTAVADLKVHRINDKPVLSWWQGRFAVGWGYGEYVVLDATYREIARITPRGGYRSDLHDLVITPQNTALVLVYDRVRRDLRSIGGPRDGVVLNNVVQEIDLRTGLVLFEWHSLDQISLAESRLKPRGNKSFDYFHINSVDVDTDGNLIVSARNTCALYKINRATGALMWRLGGRQSDFKMGGGARFCFQHDARRVRPDVLSLFDNAAGPPATREQSRGITLQVDEQAMTVRLLEQYEHPAQVSAPNQGSTRIQPNGNVLVGWGAEPLFTEFDPEGKLLFAGGLTRGKGNYRAIRDAWTGRPPTSPAVAAESLDGGRVRIFASWNGATEVARWEVLAGGSADRLQPRGSLARDGFETSTVVTTSQPYVAVRARGGSGEVLGMSKAVKPKAEGPPAPSPRQSR